MDHASNDRLTLQELKDCYKWQVMMASTLDCQRTTAWRVPELGLQCSAVQAASGRTKAATGGQAALKRKATQAFATQAQQQWGTHKQLVVFFGNAGIGTRGGWGAKSALQACRKVVERANSGKPTDRLQGKVVTVDELRTSRVSSIMNSPQPCEEELDSSKPTRPEDWKPKPGQVQNRLLRPPLGTLANGWTGTSALNLQRAGESKWRPLELCRQPHRGRDPAKGKEYPASGFKKLRD
ncbi:hypothetical protein QJQ45_001834 [Haematococcus lacustris]|nr:hypothetical protein QJQ45_001834 [Haematococcus lacustris]